MATGVNNSEKQSLDSITSDSIVLEPFDLPTNTEHAVFSYKSKISSEKILNLKPRPLIKLYGDSNVDSFDNSLIWTNNLFGLTSMLDQYKGGIDLFYLDPPYSTGMNFQSRNQVHAYKDKFSDLTYIEFMRRRFIIIHELLSDNGSIYVHIGHQMLCHLKIVMDEVFGRNNFRNIITRRKCSSKNYTKKQYPNLNDYVLFYSKSKNYIWNRPGTKPSKEWINKEYSKKDKKGRYKLVPIHAPGVRNGETGKEWEGMMPPPGKHWQMIPSKLDELNSKGEIYWSKNGNPRRKVYLTDDKKIPITDYWQNYRDAHHQSVKITGYPTEKNLDMLNMIVKTSSNKGSIVCDPFCGSGTTLQAASDLGRKFVGIDQSYEAIKTVLNRFKTGTTPMGDYINKPLEQSTQPSSEVHLNLHNVFVDEEFFTNHKSLIQDISNLTTNP
jgi:adenine-specific DNA-methyltransferase